MAIVGIVLAFTIMGEVSAECSSEKIGTCYDYCWNCIDTDSNDYFNTCCEKLDCASQDATCIYDNSQQRKTEDCHSTGDLVTYYKTTMSNYECCANQVASSFQAVFDADGLVSSTTNQMCCPVDAGACQSSYAPSGYNAVGFCCPEPKSICAPKYVENETGCFRDLIPGTEFGGESACYESFYWYVGPHSAGITEFSKNCTDAGKTSNCLGNCYDYKEEHCCSEGTICRHKLCKGNSSSSPLQDDEYESCCDTDGDSIADTCCGGETPYCVRKTEWNGTNCNLIKGKKSGYFEKICAECDNDAYCEKKYGFGWRCGREEGGHNKCYDATLESECAPDDIGDPGLLDHCPAAESLIPYDNVGCRIISATMCCGGPCTKVPGVNPWVKCEPSELVMSHAELWDKWDAEMFPSTGSPYSSGSLIWGDSSFTVDIEEPGLRYGPDSWLRKPTYNSYKYTVRKTEDILDTFLKDGRFDLLYCNKGGDCVGPGGILEWVGDTGTWKVNTAVWGDLAESMSGTISPGFTITWDAKDNSPDPLVPGWGFKLDVINGPQFTPYTEKWTEKEIITVTHREYNPITQTWRQWTTDEEVDVEHSAEGVKEARQTHTNIFFPFMARLGNIGPFDLAIYGPGAFHRNWDENNQNLCVGGSLLCYIDFEKTLDLRSDGIFENILRGMQIGIQLDAISEDKPIADDLDVLTFINYRIPIRGRR